MSAAFKLAKQKGKQNDLRRLMQEQKNSRNADSPSIVKVDSPFAKYESGQLSCQLCKKPVSTNAVWKVHVNSKQHKDNLSHAKQLKEKLENHKKEPTIQQRVAALKEAQQNSKDGKKLKSILKNSSTALAHSTEDNSADSSVNSEIPDDFFDAKVSEKTLSSSSSAQKPNEEIDQGDEALPEGFFDDPIKDAKARNIEYKNPIEEEWDKFRKEIKEAESQSLTIINDEQEESTAERQIDEIDAQIKNWARVLLLEKRKEQIGAKLKTATSSSVVQKMDVSSSSSEDEEISEDFLDWRAKKGHK